MWAKQDVLEPALPEKNNRFSGASAEAGLAVENYSSCQRQRSTAVVFLLFQQAWNKLTKNDVVKRRTGDSPGLFVSPGEFNIFTVNLLIEYLTFDSI
jgi:hypothetical protein